MAEVISIQQDAGSTGVGFGEFANVRHRGNSFTAAHNNITGIMLQMNSTGSRDLRVDIYAADGSDAPTGSVLGGHTIPNASLSTAYTQYTFSSPVTGLSVSSKYIFVLSPYAAGVYADDYRDFVMSNANPYAGGVHKKYESGAWTTESGLDFKFRIYADDAASTSIKVVNGLAIASVKVVDALAIASVKTVNGLA